MGESDAVLPDVDGVDDELQSSAAPPALDAVRPAFGILSDCSFRFMTSDLDAAVQSAKKLKMAKETIKLSKKKRKKSTRKLQHMDPRIFVARTSRFLKESKRYLIAAAVERLGVHTVHDLVLEVKTVEQNGGQMTLDGNRRRTPGGILWNILRSRYKEDYKAIMAAGRRHEKQRKQHKQEKQKRKLEGIVMVIDGQPTTKRRRRNKTNSSMAPPAAQMKRTGATVWRRKQINDIQSDVDPENSCTLNQVQSAWADSVEKGIHISCSDDVEMFDDNVKNRGLSSTTELLRMPIRYDDLLEI